MDCVAAVGIQCTGRYVGSKSDSGGQFISAIIQSFQDASTRVLCPKLDKNNSNKCTLHSDTNGRTCAFVATSHS